MDDQERKKQVLNFTETLRSAGVRSVSVSYSGCGDEGRCENLQFEDEGCAPIEQPDLSGTDVEQLADLLEGFVPVGYQDGEGGFGTITFDVGAQTISVQDNSYETIIHAAEPREF